MRSKKTSQQEAVALLRRLDKLICIGTRCTVRGPLCFDELQVGHVGIHVPGLTIITNI